MFKSSATRGGTRSMSERYVETKVELKHSTNLDQRPLHDNLPEPLVHRRLARVAGEPVHKWPYRAFDRAHAHVRTSVPRDVCGRQGPRACQPLLVPKVAERRRRVKLRRVDDETLELSVCVRLGPDNG